MLLDQTHHRGITVWLVSILTGLDLTKQENMLSLVLKLLNKN